MLAEDDDALVPVGVDGHAIMLSVQPNRLGKPRADGWEQDIVAPAAVVAGGTRRSGRGGPGTGVRLQDTGACRVSVGFGCEFAVESGGFVAITGTASVASAFKWGWSGPSAEL